MSASQRHACPGEKGIHFRCLPHCLPCSYCRMELNNTLRFAIVVGENGPKYRTPLAPWAPIANSKSAGAVEVSRDQLFRSVRIECALASFVQLDNARGRCSASREGVGGDTGII